MRVILILISILYLISRSVVEAQNTVPTVKIGTAEIDNYRSAEFEKGSHNARNLGRLADEIASVPGTWDVSASGHHQLVLTNARLDAYGRCSFVNRTVTVERYNSQIWIPMLKHRVALLRRRVQLKHRGRPQVFAYLVPVLRS